MDFIIEQYDKNLLLDVIPEHKENENKEISLFLFENDVNKYSNKLKWVEKYIKEKNIFNCVNIVRTVTNSYYVYALINKKNGHIFYVGKGIYGRLFQHEKDLKESEKTKYINEIGLGNIKYWIIENNLENGMALSLESYLINKLPRLTNTSIPKISFEYCIYLHYLKLISDTLENETIE